ncbi:DUF2382 domain-containing protein [Nakamurella sp. YIM 132087]|uniref:DUF2382 domain-containing protein n=1 Tax=Nakamurella alba TaxID=2665158 RepID=A0A7K1FSQ0_9ACTN|nr:PRC and DUF2382 domain-containing protein [Nakamurella alba]MTD17141.1 DUF2382 domain-containing protein [Nakamurella alba]
MIKQDQAQQLIDGGTVVGSDGENIGRIGQVYLDNETGDVSWVTVKTGWFGASESFVPTDSATVSGDTVTVPYDKATIKDAPHSDGAGDALTPQQEADLYSYYGLSGGGYTGTATAGTGTGTGTAATTEAPTAPGGTDDYLTRSEEQLRVGTTQREAGKARLRKYVVTEQQSVTVPVSHEEVRVVREPLSAGDELGTIGEDAVEVTLHEDQVVVNKDVVGVERVRLDTETVTEQQEVSETVRKEQIEVGDLAVEPTTGDTSQDEPRR